MLRIFGFFETLFALPRPYKKQILLLIDVLASLLAVFVASLIVFQAQLFKPDFFAALLIPLAYISAGLIMGNYGIALRFIDNRSILSLIFPVAISTLVLALLSNAFWGLHSSFSLSVIYFFIVLGIGGTIRLLPQVISKTYPSDCQPVIVYGAGEAGQILLTNLSTDKRFYPCAFVDDDETIANSNIAGVDVFHSNKLPNLLKIYNCTKVLLAIPSANAEQRRRIISKLENLKVEVQTVPKLDTLLSNVTQINQVQDIDINDLLGRELVPSNVTLMHKCITDKSVLVTGAGGSIGSALCQQILLQKPKTLILYEMSEFNLYQVNQDIQGLAEKNNIASKIVAVLGDVKDAKHLADFIKHYQVQTIYHAAAYKHVPIVEHNVSQGVRNNILGSYYVAKLACQYNVETCVLISTDKAVRPTNIMGATKRLSELCFQAYAQTSECVTVFSMVRFGNVLGSSGSVVPLFREQIKSGGPVTVTHQEITRFFMTISEASELVIQAGAMAKGGEVFVLDMGEPVKIFDLAKKMIHLMGLAIKDEVTDKPEIEIKFTGLRPGEKLYEELLIGGDVEGTTHSRIMMSKESFIELAELEMMISEVTHLLQEQNSQALINLLSKYCDGFDHRSGNSDYLKQLNKKSKVKVVSLNTK